MPLRYSFYVSYHPAGNLLFQVVKISSIGYLANLTALVFICCVLFVEFDLWLS